MRTIRVAIAVIGVVAGSTIGLAPSVAVEPDVTAVCHDPVWTDSASDSNTDYYTDDAPYIVAMDMWNAGASPIHQTVGVCNHASWFARDKTQSATNTAVLVYPNLHVDYLDWGTGVSPRISSFSSITSNYAGHTDSPGDWEYGYDIWVDGFGAGHHELMIWTENHGQTPAGSRVASNVALSGRRWDLYATGDNSYLAFVPVNGAAYRSGTLDLLRVFAYLTAHHRISTTSTLSQIDYGIEICNTGGVTGRFDITRFSVSAQRG